jgi:hypothetical protein
LESLKVPKVKFCNLLDLKNYFEIFIAFPELKLKVFAKIVRNFKDINNYLTGLHENLKIELLSIEKMLIGNESVKEYINFALQQNSFGDDGTFERNFNELIEVEKKYLKFQEL